MLKKLLIAVFVLSLVLAFSGTAMADVAKGPLESVKKIDETHPRFNDALRAGPEQPATKKPISAVGKVPAGSTVPGPPLQYFCDLQDYTSGGAAYFWAIPDAYGDDLFNMRFTADANFDCSLKVAHYLMYWPAMLPTDMRCYLWADDGFGFPGAKLDSVDIPWVDIDAAHTGAASNLFFVSADFTHGGTVDWIFSDGAEYHLGFTALDQVGGALAIISDAADGPYAGEERASENWSGLWGSMLNDWGLDVSFFIWAERCCGEIPFTDCYTDAPISNIAYFWRAPHHVYGDEEYSMKFQVDAQDTLVSVDVAIYDDGGSASSFDPAGNNTIYITVYGDDGTGLPNSADIITQAVLPPASYVFFPSLQNVPFNFVMPGAGTYHVAFGSDGVFGTSYESTLSSDGSDGVGASASNWGGGYWVDMLSGWGTDYNFYYLINICNDEYSLCQLNYCNNGLAYFWRLPDAYGDLAQAQLIASQGEECRVEEVTWYLYDNGTPTAYTTDSKISVYTDLAGLPGTELASIDIGPGTAIPYSLFPSPMTVDFGPLDVYVTSDYWIAVESYGTDSTDGIRTLSDAGGGTCNLSWAESWLGSWELMFGVWGGVTEDWAAVAESYHCCVPFGEYACNPGGNDDWSTLQGNFQRTGRSELPIGDSWCDLNLNWSYEDATDGTAFCGPTVYDGRILCAFNTHVNVFDMTGALQYTIAPGLPYMGSGVRNTPTVVASANLGTDVILLGGGDQQSILAYDLGTGALIWARSVVEVGPGGLFGATRWGTFVVLDQGGTEVAYWGTDLGKIVAAELATGALYAGWAVNPILASFSTYKTGATDGSQLFFGTYSPAGEGDIYAIDGATGTINWQLSGSGGLQAVNVFGALYTAGEEGFEGLSYDDGRVYANSRCEGDYPTDGLFYMINSADGSLPTGTATTSNRTREASPLDINRVYVPTLTRWASPPAGANLVAFNRATGAVDFATQSTSGGRYYVDAILTCEPEGVADQLFAFNEDGFLSCFNADDGSEIFRRRIDNGGGAGNIGMAGAIAPDASGDVHILYSDYYGQLFDLSKGVDRPRIQFYTYYPTGPVEFGPAASLITDLGPLFTNTGCLDLNINGMIVDEVSPTGQTLPSFSIVNVDENLMNRASSIANDLTNGVADKLGRIPNSNTIAVNDNFSVRSTDKELTNPAAAGFPTFINGVVSPYVGQVVAPAEDVNLVIDVIQSSILRGPQSFYIAFDTDDPDFFLNDPALDPEVYVTLVGGCLIDTTSLFFGVGSANLQWVTNTARLGTGDWDPHGFDIDGDGSSYYQGSFISHASTYKMAVHTQNWSSGGGEADALWSAQPDPNYCDNQCKPALTTGVSLGAMWDGASYVPITGNMVCATWLDSIQNTWDYGWGSPGSFGQPFDNDSTMGLMANQRTVGAVDVPELAQFTLAIMDFTERNGNPVDGWYLSAIHDYDVGSDLAGWNPAASMGWSYNPGGDAAWGQIKIPFGPCDGPPMINTHGLTGPMALFDWAGYWDSAYIFATSGPGYTDHDMAQSGGDGEVHHTIASHNFAGGDSYTVGVATFGITEGLGDNANAGTELTPMALLINQWAGFGRGDVNNDGTIGNLADVIYLAAFVNHGGTGPVPFMHLGDVNCDASVDALDVDGLIDYYFNCGACPCGEFVF
jgi:hypothetical protein